MLDARWLEVFKAHRHSQLDIEEVDMSAKVFWTLLGSLVLGACSGASPIRNVISAENWNTVPAEWRSKDRWMCRGSDISHTQYDGNKIKQNIPDKFIDDYVIDWKKKTVEYDVRGEWPEHAVEDIIIAENRPKNPHFNDYPRFSFITM